MSASTPNTKTRTSRTVMDENHQCRFTTRNGRRCANPHYGSATGYCVSHERLSQEHSAAEAAKLAAELLDHCDDLQSVQGIHNAFANLFKLFAAKKIARADAFLLAYIIRSLVRTALVLDQGPAPDEKGGVNLIWKNWDSPQSGPAASPDSASEPPQGESSASAPSGTALQTHDSAATLPPGADQLRLPASPPPPPFPSKPQTEFPLDEHPWGSYAARAPLRRYGPKYRGF